MEIEPVQHYDTLTSAAETTVALDLDTTVIEHERMPFIVASKFHGQSSEESGSSC
jgi:hypothetical protein